MFTGVLNHDTTEHIGCRLLTASGAMALAATLPAQADPQPFIRPTEEFHAIVRLAATTRPLWDLDITIEGEKARDAQVERLEESMRRIESRLAAEPLTLNDLLTLAAITLYKGEPGAAGFDDPVGALKGIADAEDWFVAPGCALAAAVFKIAGMKDAAANDVAT